METSAVVSLIVGLLIFGGGFLWSAIIATQRKGWM